MSVLACIVLPNMSIEKKDRINHSMDLTFDQNSNKINSPEDIRRNLKMVSGLNTADTSKGEASLRIFVNIYGLRNIIMRTIRMSSFDIVMQLVVCKILFNCLIFGDGKMKMSIFFSGSLPSWFAIFEPSSVCIYVMRQPILFYPYTFLMLCHF